jgi:hypothetical protein
MATGAVPSRQTAKEAWLAEGKALGATTSTSCWEIGQWMVRGEEQFLDTKPTSKKALRKYYANRRANWLGLLREAEVATNLAEATLRKYAQVVRRGVRVDDLNFAHHIEVQRCRLTNEKGKPQFDRSSAWEILTLAKEKGWKVAETRAEVQLRFPNPKLVETTLEKMRRVLTEILKNVDPSDQLIVLDALAEELPLMREQAEKVATERILRVLNDDDDFDFEGPSMPF